MESRLRPRAIEHGQRIAVVSPAGPCDGSALNDGLAVLEGLGWRPELWGPDGRDGQPYLAGSDEQRRDALVTALADPSIRAVICARGGFGSTRILSEIPAEVFRADPKPLIGFSDVTALLSWCTDTAGVMGIHGPVVTQLGRLEAGSVHALGALVGGHRQEGSPLLRGFSPLRSGSAEGVLRGGNLSLVAALVGTPWEIPLAGSVLLLEDVSEPAYRLDRLLTQLRQQEGWPALRGIVLGDLPGLPGDAAAARLLEELADSAPCPVVVGVPVGHGRRNVALPLGAAVCLDTDAAGLFLKEPGVERATRATSTGSVSTGRQAIAKNSSGSALAEQTTAIDALLMEAVQSRGPAAAALWVSVSGNLVLRRHLGSATIVPKSEPLEDNARFDIASLTKAMATATVAMRGVSEGWLDLDGPVGLYLPAFGDLPGWADITIRHLLQHSSGLPDWAPIAAVARHLFPDALPGSPSVRTVFRERMLALRPETEPGREVHYSDLGYLVLGIALEAAGGATFGGLFRREVALPLRLKSAGFRPVERWDPAPGDRDLSPFVATEDCPWRGGVLRGVVHDENAHVLGGVAPHAGLFASVDDVGVWARSLLEASLGRRNLLGLSRELVEMFWDAPSVGASPWVLGWEHPSTGASTAGTHFAPNAVGHLGFTGCSVWVDRETELVVALLTNAVHPTRYAQPLCALRPRLHDLVWETFT